MLGVMTGFRWYFFEEGGFWFLLRSVWDLIIVGNLWVDDKNFVWGGGMVFRRVMFENVCVVEFWCGAVSDDY